MRHREHDPVLGENLLEPGTVYRARVGERFEHLVTEHLLEPAVGELLAALFPVGLGLRGIGQHAQAFLGHQLVVQLTEPVLPARVPLQALAGEVVVVDDEDVRVRVTTGGVGVDYHEVVSAVHSFGELHRDIAYTVEVGLIGHVELVRVERQHVVVQGVLAPVGAGEPFSAPSELHGSGAPVGHAERERRCTVRAVALPLLRAVADVHDARLGRR